MKLTLHDYQKTAIKFVLGQGSAGLFLGLGLGKTVISLAAFKVLRDQGYVKKALVLAPLRVAQTVRAQEAARWDDFQGLSVKLLHGKTRNWATVVESDIAVANFDALPQVFALTEGREWPWEMLIVDELTRLKGYSTVRFKTLKKHLHKFKRRVGLTGTPAPNGLEDLFAQVYVLDQGAALGRYVTQFRSEYFDQGYMKWDLKLKPGAEERIYEKLRPLVLRMEAKDLLDMPPLINRSVEVTLPADAQRVYSQVEVDFIAELKEATITAANAAAATGKLRQVASGNVYFEKNGERYTQRVHTEKLEALLELVEAAQGRPLLVAYEFQSDLAMLREHFPHAPVIGGGTTQAQVQEAMDLWRAGKAPVMFAHPASAAHGLNAQAENAGVVFFTVPWNLELYDQFIGRVHRQGQKTPVVVHHIVAKGTVDESVMRVLASKSRTQNALLDALKEDLTGR